MKRQRNEESHECSKGERIDQLKSPLLAGSQGGFSHIRVMSETIKRETRPYTFKTET